VAMQVSCVDGSLVWSFYMTQQVANQYDV
jgi:hypothetical protein